MRDATLTVIYARHSRGGAASIERQLEDGHDLARRRGWHAGEVVELTDWVTASGSKTRDGFASLMTLIESGRPVRVIGWTWERLERNRADGLALIEAGKAHGVLVALVRGTDMDLATPAGRMVADILGAMGRAELDALKDRQARQLTQALAKGERTGGRRPFGYSLPGMVPIEKEAQALRDGFDMLLASRSLVDIAAEWNGRGLTTPQPPRGTLDGPDVAHGQWSAQSVSRTLRNPTAAGLRAHKRVVVGEATWPAIVDRGVWETAQGILRAPGRYNGGGTATRGLLTAIASCGLCGSKMQQGGRSQQRSAANRRLYRCAATAHVALDAARAEEYVTDRVAHWLAEWVGTITEWTPDALLASATPAPVDHKLVGQLQALEGQLDSLADDLEISPRVLARRSAAIEARIEEIREQLAAVPAADPFDAVRQMLPEVIEPDRVVDSFREADKLTRRAVIQAVTRKITMNPPGRGVRTMRPGMIDIEWVDLPLG